MQSLLKVVLLAVVVAVVAFHTGECCGRTPELPDEPAVEIVDRACGEWQCAFFTACALPGTIKKLLRIPEIDESAICKQILDILIKYPCNCPYFK